MVRLCGWRLALCVGFGLSACSVDPQSGQPNHVDDLPVLDERGLPEPIDEVGFIELEPRDYFAPSAAEEPARSTRTRMFYRFVAADAGAREKPVFVFFNGGPGASSMQLYTFGTAPLSLDADQLEALPSANPHSFSSLGNLLYIDSRQAGFSYGVADDPADSSERTTAFDLASFDAAPEAADFVRVVLRVLQRQPALQNNRVVLVGQSYGGPRASLMLNLLLYPSTPLLRDDTLSAELAAHYRRVFGRVDGLEPALLARQFGWQVLIQPFFADDESYGHASRALKERMAQQHGITQAMLGTDYCRGDWRQLADWCEAVSTAMARTLLDPAQFEAWMGVNPASVTGLPAKDRAGAFRFATVPASPGLDPEVWREQLGELPEWDRYFVPLAEVPPPPSVFFSGGDFRQIVFLLAARYAHTLITNAAFDGVVRSEALVPSLQSLMTQLPWLENVEYVEGDLQHPSERFAIRYGADELFGEAAERIVDLPGYSNSGHAVTLTESEKFLTDVSRFLEKTSP